MSATPSAFTEEPLCTEVTALDSHLRVFLEHSDLNVRTCPALGHASDGFWSGHERMSKNTSQALNDADEKREELNKEGNDGGTKCSE